MKTRLVRFTLLSLLLACGLLTLFSASPARATFIAPATISVGRACIINAPNGVVPGGLIGHVGWAYKSGNGDFWTFGATEGTGAFSISPGGDSHSWSNAGTWYGLVRSFEIYYLRSDGVKMHDANYYLQYRCINVTNGNNSTASTEVQKQATNGYNGLNNNCLTKAVAILKAYGVKNLPSASNTAPNTYFKNNLTSFEGIQNLPALLQVWAALNDPVNGQPINTNPHHPQRPMSIQIYNANNQLVFNQQTTASQVSGTGNYFANIVLSTSWTSSSYQVKVGLNYTLIKSLQGITLNSQQENVLSPIPLIAGDIDQNNQLNTLDYNILINCIQKTNCSASQMAASDVNDDGVVDGIDYNLWLRIYSKCPC